MAKKFKNKKFKYRDLVVKIIYVSRKDVGRDEINCYSIYHFNLEIYSVKFDNLYKLYRLLDFCKKEYNDGFQYTLRFREEGDSLHYRKRSNISLKDFIKNEKVLLMAGKSVVSRIKKGQYIDYPLHYLKSISFIKKTIMDYYDELVPNSIKFLED